MYEASFRVVVESAPDGIAIVDAEGLIILVNAAVEELFGYSRDELVGQPMTLLVQHPDFRRSFFQSPAARAIGSGPDLTVLRKDGSTFPVEVGLMPLPLPSGPATMATIVDMSRRQRQARRQLEERTKELETAKRKLEALVSNTSEIVWTVNSEGVAEEDSPSRRAFTGETLEEWLSGGCYDVIHPDDREETSRLWAEAKETGIAFTNEYRLRHVSGEWRWMRVDRAPLRDADGVLTGWVGMNKDVTEEKKAKEQLELVNSELSHRIKNLLSIIIAIAQESGKRAGRMDDYLADFRSRLEALARSHDLLMKGRWEAVDLDELVRSHLDSFVLGSDSGRISVSGPQLKIKAEVAQTLGMAFHELATNAVKYGALSNPGGRIAVNWTVAEDSGDDGRFALSWTESGGPAVTDPGTAGYGSVVITKLAGRAIRGEANLLFDKSGVQWSLNAPAHFVADGP